MATVAIGFTLLAPGTASSATRQPRVERPVASVEVDFRPAVRGQAVSVATPTVSVDEPDVPARSPLEEFADEVVRLTNIQRVAAGVAPVAVHPKLVAAADVHARDIAAKECRFGVLSHTGSDGSNAGDRIARTGLSFSRWSENIACAHTSPSQVVTGWMHSNGHRINLLDPRHTHIGVDVEQDENGVLFWVQNFAVVR